jgi:hypothetical protein
MGAEGLTPLMMLVTTRPVNPTGGNVLGLEKTSNGHLEVMESVQISGL